MTLAGVELWGRREMGRQGAADVRSGGGGTGDDQPCSRPAGASTCRRIRMYASCCWRSLLLLLAALLVLQPCGAPPINPGQSEELKLPVVRDTIKVCG